MRRRFLAASALGVMTLAGTAPSLAQGPAQPPVPALGAEGRSAELVADALAYPWAIARDGNRLLITEAAGSVVIIEDGRLARYRLETSDPVVHDGGSGLLGMALPAGFAADGRAFFYHSYRSAGRLANKVIEARFDGSAWRETRVLIAGIPGHRLYNGGRIAIGPDGHLYVTTGWTENRDLPQDLASVAGKVLRLTTAGEVPADNPFPGSPVYSYGHRNPQGLAWDEAGRLFVAEHGQIGRDEINLICPGGNYGWPVISADETRAGMIPPLIQSGRDTWAPSGIAFAGGSLYVTALRSQALFRFDEAAATMTRVFRSGDRLRDVLPVGDALYVITTNRSPRSSGPSQGDRLLRLTPRR